MAEYDKVTNAVTTTLGEVGEDGKLTNFSTVEQNANEAKTTVASVEQIVDAQTNDILSVKEDVTTLTNTSTEINNRVTKLESNFDTDGNLLAAAGTNIKNDMASTYAVKTDFNTLEGSVNALTAEMASMSTQDSHYLTQAYKTNSEEVSKQRYVTYVKEYVDAKDTSKGVKKPEEFYLIAIDESNDAVFYIKMSDGSYYTGDKNEDHTLTSVTSITTPIN